MQMSLLSRQTGAALTPCCVTHQRLNTYNGKTNDRVRSCLFKSETWNDEELCVRCGTRHSRSLAGREMMMRSFFTSSVTKATSVLSERSKAWHTETDREAGDRGAFTGSRNLIKLLMKLSDPHYLSLHFTAH